MNVVGIASVLLNVYDKRYKLLLALSFLLLLACVGILVQHKMQTGEFFEKGVSLKGGLTMTLPAGGADAHELEQALKERFPAADASVRSIAEAGETTALIIESSDISEDDLAAALRSRGFALAPGTYSVELMGSSLGQSFFQQTVLAVLVAFAFMGIVVFVTFRSPLPTLFVILAAASDIVSTIAALDMLHVKLSTAGVAALLMLIGYSVDTDILLTTKVLKRKEGTVFERTARTVRTGLLMSLTSIAATTMGLIFTRSDAVKQIMLIITIGLIFDIIYTWFQNAGILRWYLERKGEGERNE